MEAKIAKKVHSSKSSRSAFCFFVLKGRGGKEKIFYRGNRRALQNCKH